MFPNTPDGFAALLAWSDGHAPGGSTHFGMEATGGYEDALAAHLHAAGRTVSVINPTRIKYAGVMRGRRNKTDKADARLIAEYTREERNNPPIVPQWAAPNRGRAAGKTWEAVAALGYSAQTVRTWPIKYPTRWRKGHGLAEL